MKTIRRFEKLVPDLAAGVVAALCLGFCIQGLAADLPQGLDAQLRQEGAAAVAQAALQAGDASRGAIAFHQPHIGCVKCHAVDGSPSPLGPTLTALDPRPSDAEVVEAILEPSKRVRKGFEPLVLTLQDGRMLTGLVAEETAEALVLRDPAQLGRRVTIPKTDIESRRASPTSLMPTSQANLLSSRQQMLDLVRYLLEIRDGGLDRARQLQPPPAAYAASLPEYEEHLDHAGLLATCDDAAFERGKAIYQRVCRNCHGTVDQPGSLPTSLRFASGQFKNGADPISIYRTLTRGFGLMVPQVWMVPRQKYDVIHYIREAYLKPHNMSQYVAVNDAYRATLPKGDTLGPEPRVIEPWVTMDYGPSLINTYEVGRDGHNFAYKGIAVRLDGGPGGVSRGRRWMIFDHDTMRLAAAWSGTGFLDWNGIHFDGQHQTHPHLVGDLQWENPTGPGWANPATGTFTDDQRVVGRDGRRYGPLPRDWAKYRGLYHYEDRAVIAYSVGETSILESPGALIATDASGSERGVPLFTRTLELGPRAKSLKLLVATHPSAAPVLSRDGQVVRLGAAGVATNAVQDGKTLAVAGERPVQFQGSSFGEVAEPAALRGWERDFTLTARVKTKLGGTVAALTSGEGPWVPNGKTLFIRNGRLAFDVGWVGAVEANARVNDDRWHDVAARWSSESGKIELFVDARRAGQGTLRAKRPVENAVLRLGFTAPNFPQPQSHFSGELRDVRFFNRTLADDEMTRLGDVAMGLVAHWPLDTVTADGRLQNRLGPQLTARWVSEASPQERAVLVAGLAHPVGGVEWSVEGSKLALTIPAGDQPLRMTVWTTRQLVDEPSPAWKELAATLADRPEPNLVEWTVGGPSRWRERVTTEATLGDDNGPFAVDLLTHPENNPWLAQVRLTGLDFLPNGDQAVVCAWDGDVWQVEGLKGLNRPKPANAATASPSTRTLTWRRIATGLFQPLGIKWVNDAVHVTCRDQLVILRDLNSDGETDFYECLNSDHQVTEHFHEFAMGLQVDERGNFYYAKSARHALPAVVPHHGTLLRVSPDGATTEILATGFRAANGVCLNPDGSFVVTDQEGHWNPKNRINWVVPGGFYGNMFGYHDVTDSSDAAMQQPICWITNAFDRSPAELLWVPRENWGPLGESLLNLSYGYGKIYVVPFEEVEGQRQGGMCALPIGSLPTGVMRGRFHPEDHQLYTCGMFAWAGSATQPGGFYRIRATGKPMLLPTAIKARKGALELTFTDALDRSSAAQASNYTIKTWSLKRTANYGSQHYDERPLSVQQAELLPDGRTVRLTIPNLAPTWGMEIVVRGKDSDGKPFERVIHNSIFRL